MKKITFNTKILFTVFALITATPLWAIGEPAPDKKWYMSDGTFWILLAVAVILFYVIFALSEVLIWGGKKKMPPKNNGAKILSLLITAGLLLVSGTAGAQATAMAAPATVSSTSNVLSSPYLPLYILIIIEILVIVYLTLMLAQLSRKEQVIAEGKYESWISRIWDKWNYKVPIEKEGEMLLQDHDYDGIQELDNTMPPWLQYIFYFTIVFAICYLWYYNLGKGPTQIDEYNTSVEKAKIEMAAYLQNAAANYDEKTVVLSTEGTVLSAGKGTFSQYCATCHGNNAEGGVGPNLTDDYWIHGGTINDLFTTVKYGVQGKAMAAWNEILTPKQIFEVTNYIKSLHGSNPINSKAPEGTRFVEGETGGAAPADSSATSDTLKVAVN